MDAFLNFFIFNLTAIIQWLIAIILLLIGSWFVLAILGKARNGPGEVSFEGIDLSSLDTTTLREAAQKGVAVGGVASPARDTTSVGMDKASSARDETAAVVSGGAGGRSMEEIMQKLAEKEAEVQKLKESAPANDASAEEISSYLEKIKELESKLAEYEIIEDDIADLSMYKEENAHLRKRLEEMGQTMGEGGGGPMPAEEEAPATVETTEVVSTVEKSTAESEQMPVTDTPLQTPSIGEKAGGGGGDILAEFTQTLTDPSPEFSQEDQPETAIAPENGESALEGEADMDKMVAEANKLTSGE